MAINANKYADKLPSIVKNLEALTAASKKNEVGICANKIKELSEDLEVKYKYKII